MGENKEIGELWQKILEDTSLRVQGITELLFFPTFSIFKQKKTWKKRKAIVSLVIIKQVCCHFCFVSYVNKEFWNLVTLAGSFADVLNKGMLGLAFH